MKLNCFGRVSERDVYDMSEEEMQMVRDVWNRAKEREIGKHILRELIERKPQFKDYFGIHVDEGCQDVYSCREFQLQAHRIHNFLDTAVSSLGFCPTSNIYQMAYRIGQIHFYRGVNFGADNWLTFKKVTVEIVTQGGTSENSSLDSKTKMRTPSLFPSARNCLISIGWEKFMGAVIREMKRGFLDEARRNCHDEETPF